MSRHVYTIEYYDGRFPRVSGDEPNSAAAVIASATFSPRERG